MRPGAVDLREAARLLIWCPCPAGLLGEQASTRFCKQLSRAQWQPLTCMHRRPSSSSCTVMAQAREALLESVLADPRTLLAIFSFLPLTDRRAFQAGDFYLHSDLRWFFSRAPPIADARGTGTASDSSTSTRVSTSMPAFASGHPLIGSALSSVIANQFLPAPPPLQSLKICQAFLPSTAAHQHPISECIGPARQLPPQVQAQLCGKVPLAPARRPKACAYLYSQDLAQ